MEKVDSLRFFTDALGRGKYFLLSLVIVTLLASFLTLAVVEERYTSTATILPSSNNLTPAQVLEGGFPDISLFLGFDRSQNQLPLYPDILKSRLISGDILNRVYTFEEKGREVSRTLREHLGIGNIDAARLILLGRVVRTWVDRNSRAVVVSVTLDNPVLAALVVNAYIDRLEGYNREERRSSSREAHDFILRKRESSRLQLFQAENALRVFRENNRNYASSTEPGLLMLHRRLERDVEIKQALFIELGKQLKKSALEVERDTPILNVLDRGSVPTRASWPDPPRLVISFICMGLVLGVSILLLGEALRRWRAGKDKEIVEQLLWELKKDLHQVPFLGARSGGKG
ncbi:MAG: hypothetical protein JXB45_12760 [Candidatus Krumholzibacteriota bacterium]|nr:hypothetical protein [Candidatus Krumholzibacteriota bacterium]